MVGPFPYCQNHHNNNKKLSTIHTNTQMQTYDCFQFSRWNVEMNDLCIQKRIKKITRKVKSPTHITTNTKNFMFWCEFNWFYNKNWFFLYCFIFVVKWKSESKSKQLQTIPINDNLCNFESEHKNTGRLTVMKVKDKIIANFEKKFINLRIICRWTDEGFFIFFIFTIYRFTRRRFSSPPKKKHQE